MRRIWCVLVLTQFMTVGFNLENIALNKHAWQFTDNPTFPEGIWSASNAVDGDKSCNLIDRYHLTLSGYGQNAWWQVDLGSTYIIDRMKVYGRSDGVAVQLEGFKVFLSMSNVTGSNISTPIDTQTNTSIYPRNGIFDMRFSPTNAHFVRLEMPDSIYDLPIVLCEVEVFGYSTNGCDSNSDQNCTIYSNGSSWENNMKPATEVCEPGLTGPFCNTSCEDGTHGRNCSEMCGNCLNNSVCDPVSGSCPSGCDKGYIGLGCIEINYLNMAIQPGCTSYSWNISIDLALLQQKFPNITNSDVFLGGSSCKGTLNGTLLEFEYDFTQCHTSKQKHDDFFVYNNRLVYAKFDEDNAMIIRQHIWEYEVECDLVTSGQSSSHIHHGVNHEHAITVQNNINLAFYSDANFANQIKGNPVEVHTGDNVYVKVFTTIADWSMKLRLHSCFTRQTSSGAATNYFLIKDGCEVDKYTHIMSQSTHQTTFMFQDFEYSSDLEGLDVFCNATLCETSDFTPRCMQSCNRLFQRPNVVG